MRNFTFILCLIMHIFFHSEAQVATRIVKGTLTDPETNEALPGVNISIKGTNDGTVTDIEGRYEIEAPIGSTLVFSYVGYQSKEMKVEPVSSADMEGDPIIFRHKIPDDPDKTFSPYFFIQSDDPSVDNMPLKATEALVNIAGVIADVQIRQVYVNEGSKPIEAIYIFPGSTRAAVYGMTMTIGDRRLTAKIKEKEQARVEYQEAKSAGKTATLLEQNRPNVFQMNVSNIMPGDTIKVDIKYTELLESLDGTYEFVYPTVVGPRYSEENVDGDHEDKDWVSNPYLHEGSDPPHKYNMILNLNSPIPIKKIHSVSHKIHTQFLSTSKAQIVLDKEEMYGGNRDFILRYKLRGGEVASGILINPGEKENFFLMMVEPPDHAEIEVVPSREYIFIVDVSGSMHGFPLDVCKELLQNLIGSLRRDDVFNVMFFESGNKMLHRNSVQANEYNIKEAIRAIDRQSGGGGTNLYSALEDALSLEKKYGRSRTFIVITDGYVSIEKEAFQLINESRNDANLFAIGIGSSVNRYLIEGLAHAGMGEPFIVTNASEAKVVGRKFKEMVEYPMLTDISIDYKDFKVYDIEPRFIPDVFAKRPIIVYGKYKGDASGSIKLRGVTGEGVYAKEFKLENADSNNNQSLRYLWARNKIKYLDDYAGYYEDNNPQTSEKLKQEVTKLGIKYNLLTNYTSFIAVDTIIRNSTGKTERVKQPLPMPQGVSDQAIGMALKADVSQLSEIVVVGYGMQKKSCLTGSVATVKSSAANTFSNTNVNQSLAGKVSGVIVTQNSGAPGGNSSIRIRGISSLADNNSPLIVVDGVPLDNTDMPVTTSGTVAPNRIAGVNPNDIESLEVLKSANSTAIYGSRAVNGVILITTKKAKQYEEEVEVNTSFSIDKVNKLPALQSEYAQGRPENGDLIWKGGDVNELFSWGPSISTLAFDGADYAFDKNGRLVPGSGDGAREAMAYNPHDVLQSGFTLDNYVSYKKSMQKINLFASLGHTLQQGTIPGSSFERTTLNINLKHQLDDLNYGVSLKGSHINVEQVLRGGGNNSVMFGLLTTPPTFDNSNGNGKHALDLNDTYQLRDGSQRSYNGGLSDNPYWSISKNSATAKIGRIIPSAFVEYQLTGGVKLKLTAGGDIYEDRHSITLDQNSAPVNNGLSIFRQENYQGLNSDLLFDFNKYLGGKFDIGVTAGVSCLASERQIRKSITEDDNPNGDLDGLWTNNYSQNNWQMLSRINMVYNEFLVLNASLTGERTSVLASPNNLLHSEALGIAFNLTDIPSFYMNQNYISTVKLIASVASTQKEPPLFLDPNYYWNGMDNMSNLNTFLDRVRLSNNQLLMPETNTSWEVGSNLSFLNHRLDLEMSYFRSLSHNAFAPINSDSSYYLVNGGSIENSGVDLNLTAYPLNRGVDWMVRMNFTKVASLVKKLADDRSVISMAGFGTVSSSLMEGQPYGVLYGTRYLRNDQGELVVGEDGYPLVDTDMGVIGDPNPDWLLGIENEFSFKNFSLGFLIDIRKGGDLWNGTRNAMNYFGTSGESGSLRKTTGYIFEGVTQNGEPNNIPVNFADSDQDVTENRWVRYGMEGVAEDAIEDGSWVRLRNVILTYNFSSAVLSRIDFKNLSLSLFANNLLLITKYSGVDPETNLTGNTNGRGLDYFNIPNYKSFGLSIKMDF